MVATAKKTIFALYSMIFVFVKVFDGEKVAQQELNYLS